MSKPASPRRAHQQWFSLQHLAWLLDFDVSTVRRWWAAGRFGPPKDCPIMEAGDYWFVAGEGKGADVRISSRGYDFFVSQGVSASEQALRVHQEPVTGRTAGEARRVLNGNRAGMSTPFANES